MSGGEERPVLPRRLELERDDPALAQLDAQLRARKPRKPGLLTGHECRTDVEETVARCRFELLGRERGSLPSLVRGLLRRFRVELCETLRLASQLSKGRVPGVVLEQAERD